MRAVAEQPSLALRGPHDVPPADDLQAARRVFETLVSLRNLHGGAAVLPELSMGMSRRPRGRRRVRRDARARGYCDLRRARP